MRLLDGKICTFFWTILTAFLFLAVPFSALADDNGTIQGLVKTPWVKRYPAFVYIEEVEGKAFPATDRSPFMSQKGLVFDPHILPVLKGARVDFTNDDNVVHNIFTPPGSAVHFNLGTYGRGVSKAAVFDKLGEVTLLCNVHPEMVGYVIVVQNPYFALTDKAGKFEIKDVPQGTYQLKVWHEKLKEVGQTVVVESGKTVAVEFTKLKKR